MSGEGSPKTSTEETTVTPPAPTDPTPTQQPGPPPVEVPPTAPVAKAGPTPEQVKEATDYVMSKGYSLAAATKVLAEYGVERILADKGKEPTKAASSDANQQSAEVFSGELVAGRTAVRVFNVDGNKPLKIEGMRDAGTEIDIYVRLP